MKIKMISFGYFRGKMSSISKFNRKAIQLYFPMETLLR